MINCEKNDRKICERLLVLMEWEGYFIKLPTGFFFSRIKQRSFYTYHKSSGQCYFLPHLCQIWLGEWTLKLSSIEMLKPHQYFLNSVSLVQHAICMWLLFLLYTNITWDFFLWIRMGKYNQYFLNEVEYCTRAFHFDFLFFCVRQQHRHCYSVTMCTWITSGNFVVFIFIIISGMPICN